MSDSTKQNVIDTDEALQAIDEVASKLRGSLKDVIDATAELLDETDSIVKYCKAKKERAESIVGALLDDPAYKKVTIGDVREQAKVYTERMAYLHRAERALRFLIDLAEIQEDTVPHNPICRALKYAEYHYQVQDTGLGKVEDVLAALEEGMRASTFGLKEGMRK